MKQFYFIPLLLVIVIGLIFSGCAATEPSKVCPAPEGKPSWICDKSVELGHTPEQVYGWIFTAAAIGAISDVVEIEWICEFKQKIDEIYLAAFPISYESLIAIVLKEMKLIDDPKKALLIRNIVNQNLTDYTSPMLIGEYDDWMLRAGSKKFDRDMLCE